MCVRGVIIVVGVTTLGASPLVLALPQDKQRYSLFKNTIKTIKWTWLNSIVRFEILIEYTYIESNINQFLNFLVENAHQIPPEQMLVEHILSNNTGYGRPVKDPSEPLNLTASLSLTQFIRMVSNKRCAARHKWRTILL